MWPLTIALANDFEQPSRSFQLFFIEIDAAFFWSLVESRVDLNRMTLPMILNDLCDLFIKMAISRKLYNIQT